MVGGWEKLDEMGQRCGGRSWMSLVGIEVTQGERKAYTIGLDNEDRKLKMREVALDLLLYTAWIQYLPFREGTNPVSWVDVA